MCLSASSVHVSWLLLDAASLDEEVLPVTNGARDSLLSLSSFPVALPSPSGLRGCCSKSSAGGRLSAIFARIPASKAAFFWVDEGPSVASTVGRGLSKFRRGPFLCFLAFIADPLPLLVGECGKRVVGMRPGDSLVLGRVPG